MQQVVAALLELRRTVCSQAFIDTSCPSLRLASKILWVEVYTEGVLIHDCHHSTAIGNAILFTR
jgi:hypothetical protein